MLSTRIERRALRELTLLSAANGHDNARFLPRKQYARLVENLRRDGCLTSAPLIGQVQGEPGVWYVISGNHRVEAAREAGIVDADCIVIAEPLARARFVAIQLSHNAISGEDDPAVLRRLYDLLDLDLKEYSGLTDNAFDLDSLNVNTLPSASLAYLDVVFSFLDDEAAAIAEFVARADRYAKRAQPVYLADYANFDRFVETMAAVKQHTTIKNSAVALRALCELAMERLEQLDAEAADHAG